MKKKILSFILMSSMLITMSACGAPESAKTETVSSVAEVSESEPSVTKDIADKEEIVVTIWECAWGNENYENALQELADRATAAKIDGKNIKVEVTMVSWDSYYETFMTAAASGTNPDIGCQASTAPTQFADMGISLDLTPIYDAWAEEGSPIIDEIGQTAFDFQTYNGKLVGIPFAIDGNGLLYNKDVFKQAGIKQLPTTFEELTAAAEKIKQNCPDVAPFAMRADHSSQINWLIYANGGCVVDTDYQVVLDSINVTNMLDIYQSWWDKGYIAEGSAGYSSDDIRTMLMNGDAGMILTNIPVWATEDTKEHIGVISPLQGPDAKENNYHNTMSYQAYYAYNTTEHPEETLAVLKWWLENNTILYTEGGNSTVPLRESQMKEVMGSDDLAMDFYNKYFNNDGVAVPYIYPFTSYETWQGVIDGDKTAVKPLLNILTGESYITGVEDSIKEIKDVLAEYGH